MPLGSSSEAPVIRPGPSTVRTRRHGLRWRTWRCRRRKWPLSNSMRGLQEVAQQLQENLQLVVMHPMTGAIDRGDLGITEMREPSVLFGVRLPGPAFLAVA